MRKRGQSVLEYVIVLTAIIAAIVVWQNSVQPNTTSGVGKMMKNSADKIESRSSDLVKQLFP
jgi:uncharacterized protein (UPF0333 family)